MPDERKIVEHEIVIDDKATNPLRKISGAAGRVAESFNNISSTALAIGGIGGMVLAIRDTEALFHGVERVRTITGMAAQDAHAMVDAFALSGFKLDKAETIITHMSLGLGRMAAQTGDVGDEVAGIQKRFRQLGVDMGGGPSRVLLQMADAAKMGKLQVMDMVHLLNVPVGQAGKMLTMLERGRGEIESIMAQQKRDASIIDEQALASFLQMQKSRQELSYALRDLVAIVYKSILPGITKLLNAMSQGIRAWAPAAEKFGAYLVDHMDQVVSLAKTLFKLMVANKALMMTGFGGLGGVGARAAGFVSRGGRGATAGMAAGARGNALAMGLTAGMGGPFAKMRLFFHTMANKVLPKGLAFASAAKFLGPIAKMLLRLSGVGFVIALIFTHFEKVAKALKPLMLAVKDTFTGIASNFGALLDAFGPLFDMIAKVISGVAEVAAWLLRQAGKGAKAVTTLASGVVGAFGLSPEQVAEAQKRHRKAGFWSLGLTAEMIGEAMFAHERRVGKREAKSVAGVPKPPDIRPDVGTYQDFRGSTFDVRQDFAEGFDPDRVAVTFASELAELGEKALQSGLSPLFAVR